MKNTLLFKKEIYKTEKKINELFQKPRQSIGIVLPVYNRPNYLRQTLDSLTKLFKPEYTSVLIIDDCSTNEETIKMVEEYKLNGVRMIKWKRNKNEGLEKNLRDGFEYFYKQDFDLFCNLESDIVFDRMLLFELIRLHEENPCRIKSGFNIINSHHSKILREEDDHYRRNFVAGQNLFFGKEKYDLVMEALEAGEKWDFRLAQLLEEKNESFVTTKPSYVQHIGLVSALNHSAKWQSDYNI